MPRNQLRNSDTDLLRSPEALALKRLEEQVEWAVQQLKPTGMRPLTKWLHQQGIRRKDLENF